METAEQARGRYVRLADRAARLYAPAVHILGAATFVGWMLARARLGAGADGGHRGAHHHLPVRAGARRSGGAGRCNEPAVPQGVVVKAADGLERLAEVDTVVLDKTGTLTLGEPASRRSAAMSDDVLRKAAALAAHSRHPYAQAVVRAAKARLVEPRPIDGVRRSRRCRLKAVDGGVEWRLGSARFCEVAAPLRDEGGRRCGSAMAAAAPVALACATRCARCARGGRAS